MYLKDANAANSIPYPSYEPVILKKYSKNPKLVLAKASEILQKNI
jgi:hypothetical protein